MFQWNRLITFTAIPPTDRHTDTQTHKQTALITQPPQTTTGKGSDDNKTDEKRLILVEAAVCCCCLWRCLTVCFIIFLLLQFLSFLRQLLLARCFYNRPAWAQTVECLGFSRQLQHQLSSSSPPPSSPPPSSPPPPSPPPPSSSSSSWLIISCTSVLLSTAERQSQELIKFKGQVQIKVSSRSL